MSTETMYAYIFWNIFILFQIARVQPMVPEVSVFSQTSNSGGSRRPLRTVNNFEKSVEDSLGRTIPSKKAPMPHQPPIRGEFRTSSDISKLVGFFFFHKAVHCCCQPEKLIIISMFSIILSKINCYWYIFTIYCAA